MNATTSSYIRIPFDSLPSKGRSYPKGVTVSYRPYLFGEIQEINTAKNLAYDELLKKSLQGVRVTGMSSYQLTLMDALYLGIARKLSSLGANQFAITCQCDECGAIQDKVFNQQDVEFHDIEADESPKLFSLSNGVEYEVTPTTVDDFLNLLEDGEYGKQYGQSMVKNPSAIYAAMVRNRAWKQTYEEFYAINDMDDIEVIKEVDKMFHHGLKKLPVTCSNPKCKEQFEVELEGKEPLIRPFRSGGSSARDRIRSKPKQDSGCIPHQVDGVSGSNVSEQQTPSVPS